MSRRNSVIASAITVALLAVSQKCRSDLFLIATRVTVPLAPEPSGFGAITNGAGAGDLVDVVTFQIGNDGTNNTGTKLAVFDLTASTPSTGAGSGAFLFQTFDALGNGGTSVNITSSPSIPFGSSLGSWVCTPLNNFGLISAEPAFQQTRGSGFDQSAAFVNNHSFSVAGSILPSVSAIQPIEIASLVVPVGTTVSLAGRVAGNFTGLDAVGVVPVSLTSIASGHAVSTLFWTGTASAGGNGITWDTQSNANWTDESAANSLTYFDNDNVVFDDAHNVGNSFAVNLTVAVLPGSVTVATNSSYVIGGIGRITGPGGLLKTGTGTLTLSSSNNGYTGGTLIQNGVLRLGATNSLPPNGTLTLGSASGSGIVDLNGFSSNVGGLSVAGGTGNVIGNSGGANATLTLLGAGVANDFSGIIQDGLAGTGGKVAISFSDGTLTLSGNNTYTGQTNLGYYGPNSQVSDSLLIVTGSLGNTPIFLSGSAFTPPVHGNIQLGNGGDSGFLGTGPITGSGNVILDRNDAYVVANGINTSGQLQKTGPGTATLTGTISTFGNVINQGTLIFDGPTWNSGFSISPGATLQFGNGGTVGTLFGAGPFSAVVNGTLVFDHSDNIGIASAQTISGTGVIDQRGGGTLSISGSLAFTGSFHVTSGSLIVNGSLTTAPVTMSSASRLGGSGTVTSPVTEDGILSPGNSPGILKFGSTLTFGAGATLLFDIGAADIPGADTDEIDFLSLGDNLSGSGNLIVKPIGVVDYSRVYTVFDNVSTPAFSVSQIDMSGVSDPDPSFSPVFRANDPANPTAYVISFVPVPEPAAGALFLAGAISLLIRRRHSTVSR